MTLALAFLGIAAGVLTTLAGQGGGLLLLLACSALFGPHAALAITSPALLLGNAHRALLFRHALNGPMARRMILGAAPGAFAGGLAAGALPAWALHVGLVLVTTLAIAKALGWLAFTVPRGALAPAGLVVGGLTGTSGGAGVLIAPILLASGLSGASFVGTASAVALATHVGRVAAYGTTGLFARDLAVPILVVSAAIFAGNALGERARRWLTARVTTRLEYGVLLVCVGLSLAGLG